MTKMMSNYGHDSADTTGADDGGGNESDLIDRRLNDPVIHVN